MNKNVLKKLICTALVGAMVLPTCMPVSAKHNWSCTNINMLKHKTQPQSTVPELESRIIKAIEEDDLDTFQKLYTNLEYSNNLNIQIPVEYLRDNDDYSILGNLNVDRNFFRNFSLLDLSIVKSSMKCFKYLLLNGASTALSNFNDVLFYAAYSNNTEFLAILQDCGCQFDKTNIDFIYLPALNLFDNEARFNLFFHCLDDETFDQLDSSEAVRILTLLLLSEKKNGNKESKKDLYARLFDEDVEDLNRIIEKALSDDESAMYLAAAIIALPESNFPLYEYINEFIDLYILKNEEKDKNFKAKFFASIIKNCFHDEDDIDMIRKLVGLINETGCTEKLDLVPESHYYSTNVLGAAILKKDNDLTANLIKLGANIFPCCYFESTPIRLAVESGGDNELIDLLIQNGADINEAKEPLVGVFIHDNHGAIYY